MDDDSGLFRLFIAESREHLEQTEEALHRLADLPDDREAVQQCFRALHSLKGNSGYFQVPGVTALAHACEHLLDRIRTGVVGADAPVCAALHHAVLRLGAMLTGRAADGAAVETDLIARLQALAEPAAAVDPALLEEFRVEAGDLLDRIAALLPTLPGRYDELRRCLHTLKGCAAYAAHGELERLCQAAETALATPGEAEAIRSLIDQGRQQLSALAPARREPRLGDLLVDRGLPRERVEAAAAALQPGERLGDRLVAEGLPREAVEGAAQELATLKRRGTGLARVAIAKLDALVDLAAQALTAHDALAHALASAPQEVQEAIARAIRPLRELGQLAVDLRLVPIGTAFAKAERACADAARRLGKAVEFRVVGGETGIDRSVAEALGDPLIHLVRNAVDHGIEPGPERQRAGKTPSGTITVSAQQSGDQVILTVADDGGGIDPERLRRKAVEKGLLPANASPSAAEALDLIFAPGFSTAETVTDISGRGVGMDVVRRNLEALGGTVAVETRLGLGSSMILRVPATTALLEALAVRSSGERFLLPVRSVLAVRSAAGGGGISLARALSLREASEEYLVVVAHPAGELALAVDAIEGLHQVIAKPLDLGVAHHRALSGAAVMPDGGVALVLEPVRFAPAAA